jgi:hypothetical protein
MAKLRLNDGQSNNRLKLTRGERRSHGSGAHSRASRARGILSRRAQLKRVLARPISVEMA